MSKIPDDFFDRLAKKFGKDTWAIEGDAVRDIVANIASDIAYNYELISPLGVGGSGIVARVRDVRLERDRAIKISRPSPGKAVLLAELLEQEALTLLRLSHQHLIQIFARGKTEHGNQLIPYYIMEFIEGVQDSDEFLRQSGRTSDELLATFLGVLTAIEYLHAQRLVHMDLKPGNIFVTPDGLPIIADFGFAKWLKDESGATLIGGTEGYMHPDARALVQEVATDPNRLRGKVQRTDLRPSWDLFALGKTFLELLRNFDIGNAKAISPYQRRYLRLLACRLLDGKNASDETAIGLSLNMFPEIKYEDATHAKIDLQKLVGSFDLTVRIPELSLFATDTIQVSTLATTAFGPRVRRVLSSEAVGRLGTYTQLGLLNLVYPTANHNRLEHALGTFSVLCRFVGALYNDNLNPLFRQLMTEDDLSAALLAGLLHDVGQYPLAHDIEEADPSFGHEEMGERILKSDNVLRRAIESWGVSVDRVLDILKARPKTLSGSLKDRILHTLINGPIDADKIDYLMRDCGHLGLTYSKAIDFERLLRCLTIVFRQQSGSTYAALGIHEKGKIPAESIAFARYAMFGQVYWHHAYRSIKAMIHRMVWEMLAKHDNDADLRKLRESFRTFICSKEEQRRLFPPDATDGPIHRTDFAVLSWIKERGGAEAERLFGGLNQRRLFKRIVVLSRERNTDSHLMEKLGALYKPARREWRTKLRLQNALQRRLVELVENPPEAPPQSQVISADAKNSFLVDGRRHPIILLDMPPDRRGSQTMLEFIVEEDRRMYKSDEIRTGSLEESHVWTSLQRDFYDSVGKARVFCHPDHAPFLSAYLKRSVIQNAVADALREVED